MGIETVRLEPTSTRPVASSIGTSRQSESGAIVGRRAIVDRFEGLLASLLASEPGPRVLWLQPRTMRSTSRSDFEAQEREAMHGALEAARWNVSDACRVLGMPRTTFYRKLARYGLAP